MKILCLHGRGSNNKVFELQTAPLRYQLGLEQHEYEFVEGKIPCAAAIGKSSRTSTALAIPISATAACGIKGFVDDNEHCFAYFDYAVDSLRTAIQDLADYIATNGPFDAVLGFSEGACLAASFLAQQAKEAPSESIDGFRCAIFICASPQGLDNSGEGRLLSFETDNEVIKVPTAHIIGSKDPDFQAGVELSRICDHRTRHVFDHRAGHEVPRGANLVSGMAFIISKVFDRSMFP